MDLAEIVRARIANQMLGGRRCDRPEQVVAWLGAVQAQDFAAAKWALGLRLDGATDMAIETAYDEGAILRTHVMRPTWHFVTPQDIRSLLALTGPRVHARNARRYRSLELDSEVLQQSSDVLVEALEGGRYLTRAELGQRLVEHGIEAQGQRLAYILMYAELEGLVCSGPRRGRQFTYALLDERAPQADTLPRDEALAQCALRYFASHGPAQLGDFAWWCGLTRGEARRGVDLAAPQLERRKVDAQTYWFSPQTEAAPIEPPKALLLSLFDEFIIAYKDRSALAEERSVEQLLSMGNAATSVLVLGGKVAGTWRRVIKKGCAEITIAPFRRLYRDEQGAAAGAAAHLGDFLEMPVEMVLKEPPVDH